MRASGKSDEDLLIQEFLNSTKKGGRSTAQLIEEILTRQEKKMLANRLRIIKELQKETPHHAIAKQCRVSIATVTKWSNHMNSLKTDKS